MLHTHTHILYTEGNAHNIPFFKGAKVDYMVSCVKSLNIFSWILVRAQKTSYPAPPGIYIQYIRTHNTTQHNTTCTVLSALRYMYMYKVTSGN